MNELEAYVFSFANLLTRMGQPRAYNTIHSKLESDLRELADFSRIDLAERMGVGLLDLGGLRH